MQNQWPRKRVAFGLCSTLQILLVAIMVLASFGQPLMAQPMTFTRFAGPEGTGWFDGPASEARFSSLQGIAADSSGYLYVTDGHMIRKVLPDGSVTTLAGLTGEKGSTDGTGSEARLNSPRGVAVDAQGTVYVADTSNSAIRKITPNGTVTTLAGLPGSSGSTDGPNDVARFKNPYDLALDASGNIYVADSGNQTIRKITPAGLVTTLAGLAGSSGSANGKGSSAQFQEPYGLAIDADGNLYIADSFNFTIRKITPDGVVTTLAGQAGSQGTTDGTGSEARFSRPVRIAVTGPGELLVADFQNYTIRRVTTSGVVTTVAGKPTERGCKDGPAGEALLSAPYGIVRASGGPVYFADSGNLSIRFLDSRNTVTSLSGPALPYGGAPLPFGSVDGAGSAARFYSPSTPAAMDPAGNIYIADRQNNTIRKMTPDGNVTTLAGLAGPPGFVDGTGEAARFFYPNAVGLDPEGNLYIADTANDAIRRMTPDRAVTTFAKCSSSSYLPGLAVDPSGNIFVSDRDNHVIYKYTSDGTKIIFAGSPGVSGSDDGTGTAARFNWPIGIAADRSGNLYVADMRNSTVRKITPAGVVTTLAGLAGVPGTQDGTGSEARFQGPGNITVDREGNLFLGTANTIRKVTPDGLVTTIAGIPNTSGNVEGTGTSARFASPGVLAGEGGILWVFDNHSILKGSPGLPDVATIDSPTGETGQQRQLDTAPQTATSWRWQVVRREADSTAPLSSATVRNPVFTPDRPGLYIFRCTATDGVKTSITMVSLTVTGEPAVCHASRTLPTEYMPGEPLQVFIQTAPPSGVASYSVEETPPAGWAVSNVSTSGSYNAASGIITWGPFPDSQARTLSYSTTPPAGTSGKKIFSGQVIVGAERSAICGSSSVISSSQLTVDFSLTPSSPRAREAVRFQPLFTGTAAAWAWDFGVAGATSDEQFPSFVFPAAGTYNVTLKLQDSVGQSGSRTKTITVAPSPSTEPPVLFVNGFCADESCWAALLGNLVALDPVRFTADPAHLAFDGTSVMTLPGPAIAGSHIFTMTFRNNAFTGDAAFEKSNVNDAPIEELAYQLKNVLATIRAATGSPVVDIVAHSMGGLVARAYVSGLACPAGTTNGAAYVNDVRRIVTINTPHSGTDPGLWSSMDCACSAEASAQRDQMTPAPNNMFLNLLNATPVPPAVFVESLVSRCTLQSSDGIVSCDSQDVTKIFPCPAENVHSTNLVFQDSEVPSLLHTGVLGSARTAAEIFRVLSSISQERSCLRLVPGTAAALPGAMAVFAPSVVSAVLTFTGTPTQGCTVDVAARSVSGAELVKKTVPAEGSQRVDLGVLAPGTVIELVSTCDVSVSAAVSTDPAELLMTKGRVSVSVTYRNQYTGQTGTAIPLPQKDGFGFFTFSDPNNPEVFVKVLDFGASSPFLLFYAGLTDFEYTVTFQNLQTGKSISFNKPAGSFDGGANNTDLPQSTGRAVLWSQDGESCTPVSAAGFQKLSTALPRAENELLLSEGRVAAGVVWKSQYTGQTGTAIPIPQKDEFGFFSFSNPDNPEVFVKVLDFGAESPYLLFFAGLTGLEYTVTFRNVSTGQSVSFKKDPGTFNGGADNSTLKH